MHACFRAKAGGTFLLGFQLKKKTSAFIWLLVGVTGDALMSDVKLLSSTAVLNQR